MQISYAKPLDKKFVLEFCKNTFSWGDYISEVWDYWISEGNLLVIHDDDIPVAISHGLISKNDKQVWIEGIRVNPKFRRKGLATKLVQRIEYLSKQEGCTNSFMLIAETNLASLDLASRLDYKIHETWNFYSLEPMSKNISKNIRFANLNDRQPPILFSNNLSYVNSWRWFPLTEKRASSLISQNKILYVDSGSLSIAILCDSKHFDSTLLVTLVDGTVQEIKEILTYIQNLAVKKNYHRVQILTKMNILEKIEGLEKRISFHLMKKLI